MDIPPEFFTLFLRRKTTPTATTTKITGTPTITTKGTSKYRVPHFQVMLEGCANAKSALLAEPDLGTLPVPSQPKQTNCATMDPATGAATEAFMRGPASNHPVFGIGEPYAEVTVNMN
jgi:hypothetical protein